MMSTHTPEPPGIAKLYFLPFLDQKRNESFGWENSEFRLSDIISLETFCDSINTVGRVLERKHTDSVCGRRLQLNTPNQFNLSKEQLRAMDLLNNLQYKTDKILPCRLFEIIIIT